MTPTQHRFFTSLMLSVILCEQIGYRSGILMVFITIVGAIAFSVLRAMRFNPAKPHEILHCQHLPPSSKKDEK